MFVLGNLRRSVVLGKIEEQGIVKRWVRFGGAAYQIWKEEKENKIGMKQERENQHEQTRLQYA